MSKFALGSMGKFQRCESSTIMLAVKAMSMSRQTEIRLIIRFNFSDRKLGMFL